MPRRQRKTASMRRETPSLGARAELNQLTVVSELGRAADEPPFSFVVA